MPTARGGAVAVAVGQDIWVLGGYDAYGRPLREVEVYHVATDTWEVRAPLAHPRAFPAAGLLGARIVVAGGVEGRAASFTVRTGKTAEAITP